MKTIIIIAGISSVLVTTLLLWLLIAGADESRKRDQYLRAMQAKKEVDQEKTHNDSKDFNSDS